MKALIDERLKICSMYIKLESTIQRIEGRVILLEQKIESILFRIRKVK